MAFKTEIKKVKQEVIATGLRCLIRMIQVTTSDQGNKIGIIAQAS